MPNFPTWKIILVFIILLSGVVLSLPNFVGDIGLPSKKLNLGLDLRGGSQLLLEVDVDEYIAQQYENEVDAIRKALRAEKIGYRKLSSDESSVSFELRDPEDLAEAQKAINTVADVFEIVVEENLVRVNYAEGYVFERKRELVNQSIEVIRRRVDEDGTKEPIIQRQGDDRIVLQVPGAENPEEIKQQLSRTAKLTFHMVKGNEPVDETKIPSPGHIKIEDDQNRFWEVERKPLLGGEHLKNATQGRDAYGNVAVMFQFDTFGGKVFGDVTKENVGKNFASVLDGKIISAPVIREPILGGSGQITGDFSAAEAKDLSALLRSGALPASLKILEERTVGASLGADSIAAGEFASMVAVILVAIFMVLSYGFFGAVSVVSLTFNLILVIAALSLFQATLTLPGIAGIILVIGMAVDANVLIFERIREEGRLGKKPLNAIEQGFSRAFGTILDSNITTLIVAILLFSFGSGPVRGFAVTLSIGIMCSMFTAIVFSRMMILYWLHKKRPKTLNV